MIIRIFAMLGAMRLCVSALRCYHGANIAFPENNLMKTVKVVECGPLASFCRRAYGVINAKEGWILSCMAKTSLGADYCVKGSECTEVNSGKGKSSSHYMDCCCASDMCNDDTLGTTLQQGDFLKLSNMSANHFLRITDMTIIAISLLTLYHSC